MPIHSPFFYSEAHQTCSDQRRHVVQYCRPLWCFTVFHRCVIIGICYFKGHDRPLWLTSQSFALSLAFSLAQCLLLPQRTTGLHLPVESACVLLVLYSRVPEKRCASLFQAFKFLIISSLCTRAVQDPLVHHGRHFGRAVHAFCNVQTLIANGLQAMCDDIPLDESLTTVCIT